MLRTCCKIERGPFAPHLRAHATSAGRSASWSAGVPFLVLQTSSFVTRPVCTASSALANSHKLLPQSTKAAALQLSQTAAEIVAFATMEQQPSCDSAGSRYKRCSCNFRASAAVGQGDILITIRPGVFGVERQPASGKRSPRLLPVVCGVAQDAGKKRPCRVGLCTFLHA